MKLGSDRQSASVTDSLNKSAGHSRGRRSAPIPKTLRELRMERQISLTVLALAAAIKIGRLSQIERGLVLPTPQECELLENAMGFERHSLRVRTLLVYEEEAA